MSDKIKIISRENLIVAAINHRQDGNRKIQGIEWQEGLRPLMVADNGKGQYIILDGFRRFTYLTGCNAFPCIVVQADVSNDERIAEAIAKYKGDTLSLSLAEVVKFGLDKVKWGIGKYLAKDGETVFLSDMIPLYEDYHPCAMAVEGDKETDEGKALAKKLKGFHKGLNQSVFRACMLGGQYADDYVAKVKGVSTALRHAFDEARKAQLKGLSWNDARLEALPVYQAELARVAEKTQKDDGKVDGIGNYIANFLVSLKECQEINETMKVYHDELLRHIMHNDIEGYLKRIVKG